MLVYILFFAGFFFLIKGADLLVDAASSLARRFNISSLVIGLTVVAFGTSAPELFISVLASIEQKPGIVLGNILGSNMANILFILGMAASIRPLVFQQNTTMREIPFSLLVAVVLWIMANDVLLNQRNVSQISRTDGLILLCLFVLYLYYIFGLSRKNPALDIGKVEAMPVTKSILYLLTGLAGLILGGEWIVNGAVEIAMKLEVSQSLIGLTIVAVGTSLPELATTLAAASRKDTDMAIGNLIGSNIFNVLLILGVSAVVRPLSVNGPSQLDLVATLITSLLLFIMVFAGKRHLLQRWQGVLFMILYLGYIYFKVIHEFGWI